jgi:hypothetical protein
MMHRRWLLLLAVIVPLAYLAWVSAGRRNLPSAPKASPDPELASRQAGIDSTYGESDLRILMFYSPAGDLMEGDRATICYGVLNAASVRIEPPLDGVGVSVNRCVAAAPSEDTRYTLIATGKDGSVASESFVIRTHPDPYTLPNIKVFRIVRAEKDPSRHVFLLSFTVENAEEVSIEPRVFAPMGRSVGGSFYVAPEKTTTYTLTVTGKQGRQVTQQLTVQIPPEP